MDTIDQINLANNVTVRIGELQFPRDFDELIAIVKGRILPTIRIPEDSPSADTIAHSMERYLELRQYRLMSTRLDGLAEKLKASVCDFLRGYRPKQDDDVGEIFARCRLDIAIADMMTASAKCFDELNAGSFDYELGN